MKLHINSKILKNITIVLAFIVVAKLISIIILYFLPKSGVEFATSNTQNIPYKSYRVASIFGLKAEQKNIKITPPKEILQIDSLILRAVYGNEKQGFIVFSEKNGGGENIILPLNQEYKSYKLILIKPKSAILEKNGKNYELVFKESENSNYIQRVSTPKPVEKKAETYTDVVRAVSKKDVMHYAKNFDAIWKNIAIQEIKKNGIIEGFEVMSVKQSSIFGKLGLERGDIIKSVNNQEIKTYADAFKIYNNIKEYESLKIEIIRNKQKKELEYEIF